MRTDGNLKGLRTMAEQKKPRNPRWIKTAENRIGLACMLLGLVSAGLFIVALGGGFEGWAVIAGIAVIAIFATGLLCFRASAKNVQDPTPVVYHPDSPDVVFDVDRNTGKRTPHDR